MNREAGVLVRIQQSVDLLRSLIIYKTVLGWPANWQAVALARLFLIGSQR